MAVAPEKLSKEIREELLTCKICEQLYDLQVLVPRMLPCHHSLCGACIARLRQQGTNACPYCRQSTTMSQAFPEDTTRVNLQQKLNTAQQGGMSSHPRQDVRQKDQVEGLKSSSTACFGGAFSRDLGHDISHRPGFTGPLRREGYRNVSSERMNNVQELGTLYSVTSQSTGVSTVETVTSSTILTPEFQLEPGRCNAGCTLGEDGRTLTNTPRPQSGGTGQSGPRPFAFRGTCGSVDLAQPALHYWTVRFAVWGKGCGDRCEFGLASLQTLDSCGQGQRISDHDVNSATLVLVQDGGRGELRGRNWTQDVDTPPPLQRRDVTYTCLLEVDLNYGFRGIMEGTIPFDMTLGFLYDNRQPQSPRVLAFDMESCRLLGIRRLSPSPDLKPVLRVRPSRDGHKLPDALLAVQTGPGILSDVTTRKLHSLLSRKNIEMKE